MNVGFLVCLNFRQFFCLLHSHKPESLGMNPTRLSKWKQFSLMHFPIMLSVFKLFQNDLNKWKKRGKKYDVNNEFANTMILVCLVESYFEWPTRFKDRIEIQFIVCTTKFWFRFVCRKKASISKQARSQKLILRFLFYLILRHLIPFNLKLNTLQHRFNLGNLGFEWPSLRNDVLNEKIFEITKIFSQYFSYHLYKSCALPPRLKLPNNGGRSL